MIPLLSPLSTPQTNKNKNTSAKFGAGEQDRPANLNQYEITLWNIKHMQLEQRKGLIILF